MHDVQIKILKLNKEEIEKSYVAVEGKGTGRDKKNFEATV